MSTVSIIIPAYNAASTLADTLQSVLSQTYQDFEIWIIDDGSQDETEVVVQAQSDPRIHFLKQSNAGPAAARNRGVAASAGELITFLDADDCWTPDKLADQVRVLAERPDAAVAYSWTDYIDMAGQPLYAGCRDRHEGEVYGALFRHNFIESGSNLMVRRAALEEVGGFDTSLRAVEDWELWLRLAEKYSFALVPKAQILYRVMPDSNSSNWNFQEKVLTQVLDAALARSPRRLAPHRRASLTNLYQYLMFRALSLGQTRWQYCQGLRYFLLSLRYGPQCIWQRSRLMAIVLAKISLGLLLSPRGLRDRVALD